MNTPPQGSVDAMSALHAALVKELPHHCPAGWLRHSAKSRAGEAQLPASMQHWRQQPQSSELLHLSCAPLTSHTLCRRARPLVGAHLESQPLGSPGSRDAGKWHLYCFTSVAMTVSAGSCRMLCSELQTLSHWPLKLAAG